MVKLPPSSFPYGKYNGLTIPADIQIASEKKYLEWLRTQNIIGYIHGRELEVRPSTNEYGVLIVDEDDENYETWAHVPDDIWEKFLKEQ